MFYEAKRNVVYARQWDGEEWAGVMVAFRPEVWEHPVTKRLMATTPVGDVPVEVGDWVLRGPDGKVQVMKGELFFEWYAPHKIELGGE